MAVVCGEPITAAQSLEKWRDPLLLNDALVDVRGLGNSMCASGVTISALSFPRERPTLFKLISDVLKPGDCFVDAGANIGVYTVLAARRVGRPACDCR